LVIPSMILFFASSLTPDHMVIWTKGMRGHPEFRWSGMLKNACMMAGAFCALYVEFSFFEVKWVGKDDDVVAVDRYGGKGRAEDKEG